MKNKTIDKILELISQNAKADEAIGGDTLFGDNNSFLRHSFKRVKKN